MQPIATTVTDWGEAILTSLSAALMMIFAAVPKIIGFALILFVGWFVANLIARGVAAILRTVRFNDLAARSGFTDFVQRMGIRHDASGFLGDLVKWFIRLIVLVVAFDALGLPAVSDVLRTLLLWLPNVVVAMVVLVIGGLLARGASRLVQGATSEAGFDRPDLLGRVASITIWAFAIVVAVNQLGIATTLINTLFTAVVGAAALAIGLAFGLGGRDVAAKVWRSAYDRAALDNDKLDTALNAAERRVESAAARDYGAGVASTPSDTGVAATREGPAVVPPRRDDVRPGWVGGGAAQPAMRSNPDERPGS